MKVNLRESAVTCAVAGIMFFCGYWFREPSAPLIEPALIRELPVSNGYVTGTNANGARPFHWIELESSDYRTYIGNLERIGCPRATIVDIIVSDVNQLYDLRARELRQALKTTNAFWLTSGMQKDAFKDVELLKSRLAKLDSERREVLRDLLGEEISEDKLALAPKHIRWSSEESALGFLSAAKQARVKQLRIEVQAGLRGKVKSGPLDAAAHKHLQQAQLEWQRRVSEFLTPEEIEEYNLRNSATAQRLRSTLDGFEPTEEEFRTIFGLQKEFDDNIGISSLRLRLN